MIAYAWLSVVTALVTFAIKLGAYRLTHSVGLLSDALESLVNLSAAGLAVFMLAWAAQPADREHAFGHEKAEYLSAGIEGALILVAAASIFVSAGQRLLHPTGLSEVGLGLGLSLLASVANATTAWWLFRAARKHQSIALEADAHHLMSDVYTSAAVIVGVALVGLTGWPTLDPLVALLAGLWITRTGLGILRSATNGMLDVSLPEERLAELQSLLARYRAQGVDYHALRTRQAGRSCYIQLHVLVPGEWSVLRGHNLLEEIEAEIRKLVPGARLHTHLEPIEDPVSFQDIELE